MTERVALVTGGAAGIGAGIAARLSQDGWRVVVADRDPSGVAPDGARYVVCDVGDEAQVAALLRSIEAAEQRLDALVCNAGFMIRKPIGLLSLAEWSSVLTTNLTSTFLLVRAAEALLRRAKGAVLTIASSRARMSEADTESYSASKGGLVALTHALAISLGPDVRVNCISPGWIVTRVRRRRRRKMRSTRRAGPGGRTISPGWPPSWLGQRAGSSPGRSLWWTAA
jgi:hypothetical protein